MARKHFSRRSFLKTAGAAGAVAVFPAVVPSTVFGAKAPSNKIVMGAIGVGSMGSGDLNGFLNKSEVRVVAVCDVDRNHRASAKRRVDGKYQNTDCKAYLDFREVIGPDEIQLYNSRDHLQNFLDCVKSRKTTITPVETAHRSISVGQLGEIAMLTGRKIRWNPETEEIIDDPAASALLGRSYREPWTL